MANPFSNDVTVNLFQWGRFTSRIAVRLFQWRCYSGDVTVRLFQWERFSDTANLFIIILNSKTFSKYTDISSRSFSDVPSLI